MDALLRDLRYALRTLRRSPGSTGLVILTLALGIGASTAIFSAVNSVLLRPLPYDDPSRLVFVGTTEGSRYPSYTSVPDFIDWKQRLTTLEGLAAAQVAGFAIVGEGTAERVSAARISPDFLSALGVAPQLGRAFWAEEYRTGAEPVVLLSHSIWQRRWAGDPNVIGKTFSAEESRAGRVSFRVVGVTPADFQAPQAVLPGGAEIYMALPVDDRAYARSRTSRSLRVVGRLKPGVSLEAAQREAGALAVAMAAQHVDAYTSREGTLGIGVASLLGMTVGSAGDELLILLGASALLLLIGCGNVANLLLARATGRAKEIAVRSALGARRGRVLRQLLTESTCLGVAGGIGGIVIAFAAVQGFQVVGPGDFPRLSEVSVDLRALAFALGLALITGMLFGLAPGVVSSRSEVSEALREGTGRVSIGEGRTRLRSALISAETALALVVLAGAGLLINSYLRLRSVEPGFDPDDVLMMEIGLSRSYSSDEQRAAFFRELTDRARAIPGVISASSIVDPPMGYVMWAPSVALEGPQEGEPPWIPAHMVGPDYFRTMGIRLLRGRGLTSSDDSGHPLVAVVNESMARELWPQGDAVGRRIRLSPDPDAPWITVVGVANDIRQRSLASPRRSEFYVPYAQHAWFAWNHIVVRSEADVAAIAGLMRQALWDLDSSVPFDGVTRMNDRILSSLQAPRFRTLLLTGFAILSLLLAAGGLYATMLYAVGQRTHEIGIRVALGADSTAVLNLVVREGMKLTVIGIAIGLAATVVTSRVLDSFLFGVESTDPATLAAISVVLTAVALLACYLPARRAARIDPMVALRGE